MAAKNERGWSMVWQLITDRIRNGLFFLLLSWSQWVLAIPYFKDEQGHTNWQYVANWSSGILIILLLLVVGRLYFTRKALHRVNHALVDSNEQLEQRVMERTSTLNESNHLLQKANEMLEAEIEGHRQTTRHLEASRAYVESILESMPLMLVGMDHQGVVTQWNRGAEKITGLSAKEILGKVLWDVYPIIPVTKDEVIRSLETGESLQVSRSQRGQLHFEIVIYPLANTIETGIVLLIDDVTKQVQSMNQLIQKDKLSAMGELAASMAQDINLPLRKIIETLDSAAACVNQPNSLTKETVEPDFQSFLEIARQESLRTLAITNNLVEFAGAHRQEPRPQDIVEVMEHALSLASAIYDNTLGLRFSQITIKRSYEKQLPKVFCHVSELQQVFLSLLRHCAYALAQRANSPALKIPSPSTGEDEAANTELQVSHEQWVPTISVTLLESYEVLWIKIQHNGQGLTPAEQQMIFEPFFSNTLRRNGVNDNSSLEADRRQSFSHFIVTEHHGGQLAVTSDVRIGTTFHMELPLKSG